MRFCTSAGTRLRRADQRKQSLVLPGRRSSIIGRDSHGVGIHLTAQPHGGIGAACVHNGVKALTAGHMHQIRQHVQPHSSAQEVAVGPQHHCRQPLGRLSHQLGAVIAQCLRPGHDALAVEIGKPLHHRGGKPVRLRAKAQRQRCLFFADMFLQSRNGHETLLLAAERRHDQIFYSLYALRQLLARHRRLFPAGMDIL